MYLRYIHTVFVFVYIVVISVVQNFESQKLESKILSHVIPNISHANNVKKDLMSYVEMEQTAKSDNEKRYSNRTDSDVINPIDEDTNDHVSHESEIKTAKNEKQEKVEAFKEYTSFIRYLALKSQVKEKATNLQKITKSGSDNYLSGQLIRDNSKDIQNSNQKKVLVIRLERDKESNRKKNRSSGYEEKHISPEMEKILQSVDNLEWNLNNSDSEEDQAMHEEILRAAALREAYGTACMQVVFRKCLRALRTALKDVCKSKGRKCSYKFNEDFKNNGIFGCNQQFNAISNQTAQNRAGNEHLDPTGAQFTDFTRQGYLGVSCLRILGEIRNQTTIANKAENVVDKKTKEVNILRDRFEEACQKESYDKCCAAGKLATDKACELNECIKDKRKALQKAYKKRCSENYGYKGDSSESDSVSDSDSEDDSDDDSDESD